MPPKVGISDEVIAAVHQRYLAGEKIEPLAADAGCSPSGLYWRFRRDGLKRFPAHKRTMGPENERAKEAIALWDSGVGLKKVCDQMHMGHTTAQRLLLETGRDPKSRCFGVHHHLWKGGQTVTGNGYLLVLVPDDHPFRDMATSDKGYVMEHRLAMAEHLGRPLRRDETVHHVNGVRDDNRLENLQLRSSGHGQGAVWHCADCGSQNLEPETLGSET